MTVPTELEVNVVLVTWLTLDNGAHVAADGPQAARQIVSAYLGE